MSYTSVTESELQAARPGIDLLQSIMDGEAFEPFLYGITTNAGVLLNVAEALDSGVEEGGQAAPSVTEVALAIPLSSDHLHYLTGSGLTLSNEAFSYIAGPDGARTDWLPSNGSKVKVTLRDFAELAICSGDMELDEFLKQYGVKSAKPDATVARDAVSAVQPQRVAASKRASAQPKADITFTRTTSEIDRFLS